MSDDLRMLITVICAVLIKLIISETLSIIRAASTIGAAIFSAWVFTDPALHWFALDPERYRLAVAAILALLGENLIRRLLDLTGSDTAIANLIKAWRGK